MRSNFWSSCLLIASAARVAGRPTMVSSEIHEVKSAFKANSVVPDVIPDAKFIALLDITYPVPDRGPDIPVDVGMNLTKPETSIWPAFHLRKPDEVDVDLNRTFVLVGLDPDAPSPQNRSWSQVIHLLAGGLTIPYAPADDGLLLINSTPAILDYMKPSPPKSSSAHRYVFLLYESTQEFETQTVLNSSSPRKGNNFTEFAEAVKFSSPVAGNFFFESTNPDDTGPRSSKFNIASLVHGWTPLEQIVMWLGWA